MAHTYSVDTYIPIFQGTADPWADTGLVEMFRG